MQASKKVSKDMADKGGAFTGKRHYRDQAYEILGVSMAIIIRSLHNAIFLNLRDLGIDLPPYTEEVIEQGIKSAQAIFCMIFIKRVWLMG